MNQLTEDLAQACQELIESVVVHADHGCKGEQGIAPCRFCTAKRNARAVLAKFYEAKAAGTLYMLEGEWSGYHPGQRRVSHREYLTPSLVNNALVDWCKKAHSITFTDGTYLTLTVKEVQTKGLMMIDGYTSLIRDCFQNNVKSVAALINKKGNQCST